MNASYCDECGGYLATLHERTEQRCERCQFAREWSFMQAMHAAIQQAQASDDDAQRLARQDDVWYRRNGKGA